MTSQIEIVEKDVARHEEQIRVILEKLDDLSLSHAELGFCLKTYMEKFPTFEKKIDDLAEKIQQLMPSRQNWDMERRVESSEKSIKNLNRYCLGSAVMIIVLVLLNPDAASFVLGVLQNKVP